MRAILVALAMLATCGSPAHAYDPEGRARREAPPPPSSSPLPVQLPPGLYRVTEVYAGDVVTRSGELTTYSTRTEHRVTDTYARVLETVETGARSRFDGAAFNGRGALSNGTPVGGTYYQNFVLRQGAFVPVSTVFFQDDSERARREAALRAAPTAASPASPAPASPASPAPAPPRLPAPAPAPARPGVPAAPPAPATVVSIGLDPVGGSAVLDRLAVLRGARYAFAVNVRGTPIPVTLEAWQLVDGVNEATNPAGWRGAAERLQGHWSTLPAPDGAWTLTLRVRVRPAPGGAPFEASGRVSILVRSPAVVE